MKLPVDLSTAVFLSTVALWSLGLFHSFLLIGIVRTLYARNEPFSQGPAKRLGTGSEVPSFETVDLEGVSLSNEHLVASTTAILFVSPRCPSCAVTLYELEALDIKTQGNVVVICRGNLGETMALAHEFKVKARWVADADEKLRRAFGVTTTPMAVLVDGQNRIRSYGEPLRAQDLGVAPVVPEEA